jgi:hypothetical protein
MSEKMPLESPDQQHWQSAVGYIELGVFADANSELKKLIRSVVPRLKF